MHEAIRDRRKIAVRLLNYTRGEPFLNDLTLEPLMSDAAGGDMAYGMASGEAPATSPRVTHYRQATPLATAPAPPATGPRSAGFRDPR